MVNPEKYKCCRFKLNECKGYIELKELYDEKEYAIAHLNIQLPDGRWVVFCTPQLYRIPLYKERVECEGEKGS